MADCEHKNFRCTCRVGRLSCDEGAPITGYTARRPDFLRELRTRSASSAWRPEIITPNRASRWTGSNSAPRLSPS